MERSRGGLGRFAFVGPTLVLLIAFNLFPLLYNVVLSFTNAELVGDGWKWIGGRNYERVFTDARFGAAVRRTAWFVFCAVGLELGIGFATALALQAFTRVRAVLVTALLIPMMLSPAVMGLFWNLILNGNHGITNQTLDALSLPQPQWLTDREWKLFSVILIDVWMWTPFLMLISMAGLAAIPKTLYEAAEVDRASRWTVFRRVTLPLVAPYLGLAVLLRFTDALKQFDLVMATQGPNDTSTQTLSTLLYQVTFRDGKVGLGSAYACVILVLVIALATVFTRYLETIQRRTA
ncbi:MAG: sugar ABC transporter permease [Planctomycetes bacterium]|nr:sugar ABC transporter permease [Planctomycetota bacterium]